MTPPPSIMDNLSAGRLFGRPLHRRLLLAPLAVALAMLTSFPREYRAAVSLVLADPPALGPVCASGRFDGETNVSGSGTAVEIGREVARGAAVRRLAIARLRLVGSGRFADRDGAERWIGRSTDIRALRGGILQISAKTGDPATGRRLVAALADATRERLAQIDRTQARVAILEPAHVDPDVQFRTLPLALLILVLLGWGAIELYQLRPPVGAERRYLRPVA